ncbi:MAG: hypothetical protein M1830_005940 [Pleopsidium flavum]|nr:MAG: hypothetical protein M1830_005940 [Pleopsidium flavum]
MALVLQTLEWIEEDQVRLKNFALIPRYLENTAPDTAAVAAELTAPINDLLFNSLLSSSAVRTAEHHLWLLWDLFLVLVKQMPHSHPWQGNLVALLAAIKKYRRLRPRQRELRKRGLRKANRKLVNFAQHWWMKPFSVDKWVRLKAFLARVTVSSVLNFKSYAIWLLCHAVKEPRRVDGLDDTLPAAVAWILYAGNILYHNGAYGGTEPKKTGPASSQDLYKGPDGFSKERWHFWKERFGWAGDNDQLKKNTRTFANEATMRWSRLR